MRTRVESIDETVARLSVGIDEAAARAQQTQAEFETVQGRVGELDAGEVGLDDHHDRTVAALRLADERVAELQSAERGAERQVASLRARIDALSVGLDRKDGAAWLQKNRSGAGLFGSVAKLVKVRPGYEAAVAAVLGAAADAVAAEDFGAARSAVAALKESDGGHAAIVLGDWPAHPAHRAGGAARRRGVGGGSGRCAVAAVAAPSTRCSPVSRWCADLSTALDLVAARPQLRAVTADGDLVGAGWVSGGSDRKPSTLEITSEIDKARDELAAAEKQAGELTAALSGALAEQAARQDARRAGAGGAQRIRRRDLGDLRAAGPAGPGRPRRRRRVAAADPAARRTRGRAGADGRGTRRARGPVAQRRTGTDVRRRTRRTGRDRWPPPRPPGPPRSRPGWPCAPPRNARMPFAGGRIRCAAPPRRNVRPGCAPSAPARHANTPRRWPPRSPSPAAWSPRD